MGKKANPEDINRRKEIARCFVESVLEKAVKNKASEVDITLPLNQKELFVEYEYPDRFKKGDPSVRIVKEEEEYRFRERRGPSDVMRELKSRARLKKDKFGFSGGVFEYSGREIDIAVYEGDEDEDEREVISLIMQDKKAEEMSKF